jgi:hypothetical protein
MMSESFMLRLEAFLRVLNAQRGHYCPRICRPPTEPVVRLGSPPRTWPVSYSAQSPWPNPQVLNWQ